VQYTASRLAAVYFFPHVEGSPVSLSVRKGTNRTTQWVMLMGWQATHLENL